MKISTRYSLSLAVLLLAGSVSALGAPVVGGTVPTKIVELRDLDLGSAAGARTLYDRIKSAARTVCRDADRFTMRTCRARAIDGAVSRVGNPLLSSLHRSAAARVVEVARR